MEWPDDLAAELPEPNPDEPKTLRDDILDELRDHLQSSLELEHLRGTPASEAEQNVLTRFGNPVRTARQLWWDAMKGRIMSQRITLGLVIVLCLLSVAATALLWQTVQQGQETSAALIAELRKLADREVVPAEPQDERLRYLEWIPVTLKLEYENGDPVTDDGFQILFERSELRQTLNSFGMEIEARSPDLQGELDFGLVRPGYLAFLIGTPWGERLTHKEFAAAGSPFELVIQCPREEPAKLQTALKIDWPVELRDHKFWTYLYFNPASRIVGEFEWKEEWNTEFHVLLDPEGKMYQVPPSLEACEPGHFWSQGFSIEDLQFSLLGVERAKTEPRIGRQEPSASFAQYIRAFRTFPRHAYISTSLKETEIPERGVDVKSFWVLKQDTGDHPKNRQRFQIVLPIDLGSQKISLRPAEQPSSDLWVHHPSELIVELVRKRLERINEEEDPEKETATAIE